MARAACRDWQQGCKPCPTKSQPSLFSLFHFDTGGPKLVSNFYAGRPSSFRSKPAGGLAMLDLVYLALGIGLFALMGLYARWAANA